MGLKDFYNAGLGTPNYSKRKLGKVFIGAESGALVTTDGKFDFRKTAQVQASAAITADKPFALVAFPVNTVIPATGAFATLAELDKAFGDAGDHPADFAYVAAFDSKNTRLQAGVPPFPAPAEEFGNAVLTIPVRSNADPKESGSNKLALGLGLAGALGLLALISKH